MSAGRRSPSGPTRVARLVGWSALAAGLGGAAVLLVGPPRWLVDRLATAFPGCLYRVPSQERVVALTIDDAPDASSTPLILDVLRRHSARATFFTITGQIPGNEQLLGRVVAEGHELGNHLTADRPSIGLDAEAFARDLEQAQGELAGYGLVRWARPGSGWYSRSMITAIERAGLQCALASVYPYDATIPWAGFAADYVLRNVYPGAIIVLHDRDGRGRRAARVLAQVLPELRERGYRVVTLSELTGRPRVHLPALRRTTAAPRSSPTASRPALRPPGSPAPAATAHE